MTRGSAANHRLEQIHEQQRGALRISPRRSPSRDLEKTMMRNEITTVPIA